MTMTLDEVVKFVRDNPDAWEHETVLADEIERLQKVVADQALTIGTQKDTIATQHLALDVALKALKWFEQRDEAIRLVNPEIGQWLKHWSSAHPKPTENPPPGAAT